MFKIIKKRIKIPKVSIGFVGAMVASSIRGNPKIMAGKFWYIMLSATGLLKSGSTSRNKMIPVLAVPHNIPNIPRNCSWL